jgi:opacity protein-like surface antigen
MKKAVIMLLVLVVPASLWAMDIPQGKYELSGSTAFNFSDTSTEVDGAPDIDTTSFSFELDANYYLRNNLGLGLLFLYENDEVDSGGISVDSSTFIIGPQVIYHFPLNEKVSLFVKGAVGYATLEVDNEDADGWAFQLGGGLKYFLTNSASINGALTYQTQSLETDSGVDIDSSGINIGVGLSIYF